MQNINIISKKITLEDGREIIIETGKLARQADGAVVVKMGKTMLLATVVAEKKSSPNLNFLPLSVEYQEKFAGGGRIPGGFLKREGKLSDREVLTSRLVDRAIRPMFPKDFHAQVQVCISLVSLDPDVAPETLAALAASSAIAVSDIPFLSPISEVRVARIDGKLCINPSPSDNKKADIDLIIAATLDHVIMVEGDMAEVAEEEMIEAIYFGHNSIIQHCNVQSELSKAVDKVQKRDYQHAKQDDNLAESIMKKSFKDFYEVTQKCIPNKQERKKKIDKIKEKYINEFSVNLDSEIDEDFVVKYLDKSYKSASRKFTLESKKRIDGREYDEIRPIWCEVDILPGAHGSALFTRGETQSLTTVTLGSKVDEQLIDSVMETSTNKFMLHYNFPGFSTGDIKPPRGPGRREVGHGNLAMEALARLLPTGEDNPYTIRIVSDILESNGSSSMATVCASSLALMDSGIKFNKPVSGIAMGLITDEDGEVAILSDIIGDEDFIGDMDFKITGTKKGITACQMDIKVEGISKSVLEKALIQAKKGRLHILDAMNQTIKEPRSDFKPNAPRMETIIIDESNIRILIGPGGKNIQDIQKETSSTISIENEQGVALVKISAPSKTFIEEAKSRIRLLLAKPEIGKTYHGKVKTVRDFGAFVEFLPGKDGLLHISEIMWDRVSDINEVIKIGDHIDVKLIEIDRNGKYKLSKKSLIPKQLDNI